MRLKLENFDFVGEMKVSGKVTVTDPCYVSGSLGQETVQVLPGVYGCYVEYKDCGDFGKRVKGVAIVNKRCCREDVEVTHTDSFVAVDSGTAGFFDSAYYDRHHTETLDKRWFGENVVSWADSSKVFLTEGRGFVSESGHGDGCYGVWSAEGAVGDIYCMYLEFIK